jgi:excisionase family DNA binding protein
VVTVDQELFRIEDVAMVAAQSRSKVYADMREGHLASIKIGSQRRFTRAQLGAYVTWLTASSAHDGPEVA